MNKLKNLSKQQVIWILIGVWAVLIVVIMAFLFSATAPDSDSSSVNDLKNSNNIVAPSPVSSEEAAIEYTSRQSFDDKSLSSLRITALNRLSEGDYGGLSQSFSNTLNKYQTNPNVAGEPPEDYIERIKKDLAIVSGVNDENGKTLLNSFASSEVLAAAVAYLPMSAKYESFVNYDSCVVPAVSQDQKAIVNLRIAITSESELQSELENINQIAQQNYFDIAIYDMTLWGEDYRLYLVQSESGYWSPYLLKSLNELDSAPFTVLQAIKIMGAMAGTGKTLDDVVVYTSPLGKPTP